MWLTLKDIAFNPGVTVYTLTLHHPKDEDKTFEVDFDTIYSKLGPNASKLPGVLKTMFLDFIRNHKARVYMEYGP